VIRGRPEGITIRNYSFHSYSFGGDYDCSICSTTLTIVILLFTFFDEGDIPDGREGVLTFLIDLQWPWRYVITLFIPVTIPDCYSVFIHLEVIHFIVTYHSLHRYSGDYHSTVATFPCITFCYFIHFIGWRLFWYRYHHHSDDHLISSSTISVLLLIQRRWPVFYLFDEEVPSVFGILTSILTILRDIHSMRWYSVFIEWKAIPRRKESWLKPFYGVFEIRANTFIFGDHSSYSTGIQASKWKKLQFIWLIFGLDVDSHFDYSAWWLFGNWPTDVLTGIRWGYGADTTLTIPYWPSVVQPVIYSDSFHSPLPFCVIRYSMILFGVVVPGWGGRYPDDDTIRPWFWYYSGRKLSEDYKLFPFYSWNFILRLRCYFDTLSVDLRGR